MIEFGNIDAGVYHDNLSFLFVRRSGNPCTAIIVYLIDTSAPRTVFVVHWQQPTISDSDDVAATHSTM